MGSELGSILVLMVILATHIFLFRRAFKVSCEVSSTFFKVLSVLYLIFPFLTFCFFYIVFYFIIEGSNGGGIVVLISDLAITTSTFIFMSKNSKRAWTDIKLFFLYIPTIFVVLEIFASIGTKYFGVEMYF